MVDRTGISSSVAMDRMNEPLEDAMISEGQGKKKMFSAMEQEDEVLVKR
jgi:hypothetical protein